MSVQVRAALLRDMVKLTRTHSCECMSGRGGRGWYNTAKRTAHLPLSKLPRLVELTVEATLAEGYWKTRDDMTGKACLNEDRFDAGCKLLEHELVRQQLKDME